ncbi:hypothetical protein OH76DRAFT_1485128 [Lentinus brumalis]|uniref:F-box domain-containing protein n=1 Tax=Lentinus brumalis TaxID=2498619 RepID=A0A371D2S4_9APHY|nr:hypothetical protein OH76DRAFT_1485128 [Polyporus brumalis]
MADQHLSSSDRLVSSEESILGTQMNDNDLANVSASAVALHLLTLTYDVQLHIWSFLRTNGLSALMRTCRQFHELALPTLCARSRDVTLSKPSHIASFHDFIRVPHLLSPAIPRTSLVRELHIDVSSNALTHANLDRSAETRAVEVLPAILRSCPRLKCLSVLEYYLQPSPQLSPQLSFQLVLDAISTLHSLEEFMIDFGKVKYGYGELRVLRTIAQLHLRKLTITGISNTIRSSMTLVSSLGQLAPILAELELPDYAHRHCVNA